MTFVVYIIMVRIILYLWLVSCYIIGVRKKPFLEKAYRGVFGFCGFFGRAVLDSVK